MLPGKKTEMLEAFLNVSKWATEMFDVIEDDTDVSLPLIYRTNVLIEALTAARDALVVEYIVTGKAGEDALDSIRKELLKP